MDEENQKKQKNKKITVVTGDGTNLDISPVYEHIKSDKLPNTNKKNIIIPKGSSTSKNENDRN